MALEFRTADFFHPVAILRLKRSFDRNPWLEPEALDRWRDARLREIVAHAYANVPYYRESFDRAGVRPSDIRGARDLARLPLLSKDTAVSCFERLRSTGASGRRSSPVRTSGTTGRRVTILMDGNANSLEFVHYWRFWGWAGYRLGDRFAEFSAYYFLNHPAAAALPAVRLPYGRLLLNATLLSPTSAPRLVDAIRTHGARFLKGAPSTLHHFALMCGGLAGDLRLKALFSAGEVLAPQQRRVIERAFGCKVRDSYGQMERVAAAAECPSGTMHVLPDYGVFEIAEGRVVGTSLHNSAMPLIRYDVGDYVDAGENIPCACGRRFPSIKRILGRRNDVVRTPDGRIVTGLFLVFDDAPGIARGQVVQESASDLTVRVVPAEGFGEETLRRLRMSVAALVGPSMKVKFETVGENELFAAENGKFRTVISRLPDPDGAFP